jgi:hypothetical protein
LIHAQSTLVHSSIGKSTHLRCSATAPYDTSLYWRRIDHIDLSNQSGRFRQQQHNNGDIMHSTLYIKDIDKDDFGHYACFAESKAGRSEATIELKGIQVNMEFIRVHRLNRLFLLFLLRIII